MPLTSTRTEAPEKNVSPLVRQCMVLAKEAREHMDDENPWFAMNLTQEELREFGPETDKDGKSIKVADRELKGLSKVQTSLRRAGNDLDVTITTVVEGGPKGVTVLKYKARARIVRGSAGSEEVPEDFPEDSDSE